MPNLGPAEILVILIVALLVLGPKKLPEAGRQVGKALAEFRRWSSGIQSEFRDALDVELPLAGEPPPSYAMPGAEVSQAEPASSPAPAGDDAAVPAPATSGAAGSPSAPHLRPPWQFPEQQSFN